MSSYERKYKEALKRAREIYPALQKPDKEDLVCLDEVCDWLRKNVANYINGDYNVFHQQVEYDGTVDVDGLIKKLKSDFL